MVACASSLSKSKSTGPSSGKCTRSNKSSGDSKHGGAEVSTLIPFDFREQQKKTTRKDFRVEWSGDSTDIQTGLSRCASPFVDVLCERLRGRFQGGKVGNGLPHLSLRTTLADSLSAAGTQVCGVNMWICLSRTRALPHRSK